MEEHIFATVQIASGGPSDQRDRRRIYSRRDSEPLRSSEIPVACVRHKCAIAFGSVTFQQHMGDLKLISPAEVAEHKTASDCWFIINGKVYDVTSFLPDHPGGEDALLGVAGKDGTDDFEDVGHSDSAREQMEQFLVGVAEGYSSGASAKAAVKEVTSSIASQIPVAKGEGGSPSIFLKFIVPLLILGLAFVLRFWAKKDVQP